MGLKCALCQFQTLNVKQFLVCFRQSCLCIFMCSGISLKEENEPHPVTESSVISLLQHRRRPPGCFQVPALWESHNSGGRNVPPKAADSSASSRGWFSEMDLKINGCRRSLSLHHTDKNDSRTFSDRQIQCSPQHLQPSKLIPLMVTATGLVTTALTDECRLFSIKKWACRWTTQRCRPAVEPVQKNLHAYFYGHAVGNRSEQTTIQHTRVRAVSHCCFHILHEWKLVIYEYTWKEWEKLWSYVKFSQKYHKL